MNQDESTTDPKYKNSVTCPVCKRFFNAKAAWKHIERFHKNAPDKELALIRDAKRSKVPFSTREVRPTKSAMLSQVYWSAGPDFSGGAPSLGKKR